MKKILSAALILGATALMACPMGQGMMGAGMCKGGFMEKCQCDVKQLPNAFEALDLSDKQKEQIVKLREEMQNFRNKQHDKMLSVLTPEQRGKIEYLRKLKDERCDAKGPMMPGSGMGMGGMGGMGCKNCK